MCWDFELQPEDLTWETGSSRTMEVMNRFMSTHLSCRECLQHWHFHNRREGKKNKVFNPLDCCWFSSNKHESVSLIVLYTANVCVMCQFSLCVVRISHWGLSASITNIWKSAFVCILGACMREKESKKLIPKTLSHPLIFISEGDQSTSFWEDDFPLLG